MQPLNCLFIVQGEGRGHLTQALALRAMLARAGHRVRSVLVGYHARRGSPDFFRRKIGAPVTYVESLHFSLDRSSKSVRLGSTMWHNARRVRRFRESLRVIDRHVRWYRPDVVVNFYEPLGGLYYAAHRPAVPMVCIAHQYMFLHPAYDFPKGQVVQRHVLKHFTRVTALGATRTLALSLYDAPDRPGLSVMPPLLRDELFEQPCNDLPRGKLQGIRESNRSFSGASAGVRDEKKNREAPFLLAYVLNSGYADEIMAWHERHPEVQLHCFWDRQDAREVEVYDDTLTFHRLDDEAFLSMMARCQGVVTTAGFESVAEAMYLGKPVLMVPVEGHFEQQCNARDAAAVGAGVHADHFEIGCLLAFRAAYQRPTAFQQWVDQGEARFVRAIERAARVRPVAVPVSEAVPA